MTTTFSDIPFELLIYHMAYDYESYLNLTAIPEFYRAVNSESWKKYFLKKFRNETERYRQGGKKYRYRL